MPLLRGGGNVAPPSLRHGRLIAVLKSAPGLYWSWSVEEVLLRSNIHAPHYSAKPDGALIRLNEDNVTGILTGTGEADPVFLQRDRKIQSMKNQPIKATHKENFYDLINRSAQPLSGARLPVNPKMSAPPISPSYSGKQIHSRNVGGASGRHGGRSR